MKSLKIYKKLKVVVTGSTGFKGSWLCFWLNLLKANVVGIGLRPEYGSIIFNKLKLENKIKQYYFDINNFKKLDEVIKKERPDIVFHLAAQSIVSLSYAEPLKTMMTNVIGSSNVLETVRKNRVKNLVYITSDKCYLNDGRSTPYFENDLLGGEDPYSSSKACAELAFQSYYKSYLGVNKKKLICGSTRAGNVIGGGDMKKNRIVPDTIKSLAKKSQLIIRNPKATRPWQHVLEPISGYLILGNLLINRKISNLISPSWNFGPNISNCKTVLEVVTAIIDTWGERKKIIITKNKKFKESTLLMLSNNKAKKELNWAPRLSFKESIRLTVDWYKSFFYKSDVVRLSTDQIEYYLNKK